MTFVVGFKRQFQVEFSRFPVDQQTKVVEFIKQYQAVGLSDFSKYEGKISPSWSGLDSTHSNYAFAYANDLWHYHIGIPSYKQVHPTYKTSDWVLHFQWIGKGPRIDLVDLYQHYKVDGSFYLPPQTSLAQDVS